MNRVWFSIGNLEGFEEEAMATRRRLFVSPDGARWKAQWEGGVVVSSHDTQTAAVRAARGTVRSLPQGTCSQIMVQGADGRWRTEWTYGQDPYPPAG
jgi:hypothetical protein